MSFAIRLIARRQVWLTMVRRMLLDLRVENDGWEQAPSDRDDPDLAIEVLQRE